MGQGRAGLDFCASFVLASLARQSSRSVPSPRKTSWAQGLSIPIARLNSYSKIEPATPAFKESIP
jgi:hypothetical protein